MRNRLSVIAAFTAAALLAPGVAHTALAQRIEQARVGVAIHRPATESSPARPQAITISSARSLHILLGMASGLVIGGTVEAIELNSQAKRCHSESCEVQAADGLAIAIVGLGGAVIGGVVGALWPVR